ncbi:hypothetical protein ACFY00_00565 [Kitasatospora sp. NPDC001540]|uniref:hypothetical protein n=1 Tax=Kitasatospora sp. NPDC001540 TaxID=3364014 RepID=UPI0036C64909
MPAERCPRCGTARTAGSCACNATSPVEDTAVLPHLEGPPLVRPYVAGASVVEPGDPAVDPFATRVGPPPVRPIAPQPAATPPAAAPPVAVPTSAPQPPAVQPITGPPAADPPPPGRPPHVPQAASPFVPPQNVSPQPAATPPAATPPAAPAQPHPDAAATRLLPPVPPQDVPPQNLPPQDAPGRFVPIPPPGRPSDQPPAQAPAEQTVPLTLGPVVAPPPPSPIAASYPPVPPGPPGAGEADADAPQLIDLDGHDRARATASDPQHAPQPAQPPHEGEDERWPAAPGADLGMFTFREDDADGPVSRADRRERRRQSADRRRLVIAGGAVGVTALGASLAMLLSSSPSKVDHALPAPTGPAVSSPTEVSPDPTGPAPSAVSSAPAAQESPSPSRTKARPTQAVTTKAAAPPSSEAPAAPSSPTAPSSTPPPTGKALKFGDTGPEVTQMQQALMAYRCNRIGPLTIDRTRSGQLGFGDWTRQVLQGVQQDLFGDSKPRQQYQDGVYDAATQAALARTPRSPDC